MNTCFIDLEIKADIFIENVVNAVTIASSCLRNLTIIK